MSFSVHLEYIFHITFQQCKCYFTYAVMERKCKIDRGQWCCPKCGAKGSVKIEEEV